MITQFACGPEGFVNTVDLVLKGVDITTSVNYASFIQTERIEVRRFSYLLLFTILITKRYPFRSL